MTLLTLRQALEGLADRGGHYGQCQHRQWINGYGTARNHEPGAECVSHTCDGTGAPCSKRCRETRAALDAAAEDGCLRELPELIPTRGGRTLWDWEDAGEAQP